LKGFDGGQPAEPIVISLLVVLEHPRPSGRASVGENFAPKLGTVVGSKHMRQATFGLELGPVRVIVLSPPIPSPRYVDSTAQPELFWTGFCGRSGDRTEIRWGFWHGHTNRDHRTDIRRCDDEIVVPLVVLLSRSLPAVLELKLIDFYRVDISES
jgi:hypothetical protein